MGKIVQEKFEVRSPQNHNDDAASDGWVSDASVRRKGGMQGRNSGSGHYQGKGEGLNCLPPGMNIEDQEYAHIPEERTAGGMGTGSQATEDVNPTSLREGFDRKRMRPTDDMYTREHNDAFYDTVEVDGVEGFVERNNYLDRL